MVDEVYIRHRNEYKNRDVVRRIVKRILEDHSNIESAVYADLRKQKLNTPIYREQ